MDFGGVSSLKMALVGLTLLVLIQLPESFVYGSVIQLKGCGVHRLAHAISSDEELFYINGNKVDKVTFCNSLEFHVNGCSRQSGLEEWQGLGRKYCGLELELYRVRLPQRVGRKNRRVLETKEGTLHKLDEKFHAGENNTDHNSWLTPKTLAMAVPGMLLLCCVVLCPCLHSRRKEAESAFVAKDPSTRGSVTMEVISASEKIPPSPHRVPPSPRFPMSPPRFSRVGSVHLNMSQIIKATNNFSQSLQIGEGGFATVYQAQLQDGQVVAIKRAKRGQRENLRTEFSSEVELLAKIEHRNLVRLLGYVDKGNECVIITEYVPNGTLREHLDGRRGKILDFNQRLEISIDVAHALTYLHLYAEKQIIHRDVKSSNILLTESYRAKVADFGFARLGPNEADRTHISTKVKGTAGYLDPEYLKTYQLTSKSDVYSFGVLLVEIFTGRRPVEPKRAAPKEKITIRWAFQKFNDGDLVALADPLMEEVVSAEVLTKMFELAFQCAAPTRADRPDMKDVGKKLWGIRMDYLRSVNKT
ncbi:PREDICTED: calmodulin-binding receptor-like cytoplasmic kinase 3 [Nelumbo nucifera]|uniref:non-specific serine/threonine protein kinase n=1 Tax=Nelumbo nucifera TaxID=4432 RepID=A0A1U7ZQ35_NELNU|nr:PREDICTED: calmodulin-binding receptor-like cytoplasmic kinase 3 [Nelumbo nucifera]